MAYPCHLYFIARIVVLLPYLPCSYTLHVVTTNNTTRASPSTYKGTHQEVDFGVLLLCIWACIYTVMPVPSTYVINMENIRQAGNQQNDSPRSKYMFSGIGAVIGGASGLFFAVCGLFVKLLSHRLEATALSFTRAIFMFACGVIMALVKKDRFWTSTFKDYLLLFWTGILLTVILVIQYKSFQNISLSDALTLISCSSFFIAIFNAILFKTQPSCITCMQIIGTIVGCLMCAKPDFILHPTISTNHKLFGQGLAILVAFLLAILYICLEKGRHITISTMILSTYLIVLIVIGFQLVVTKDRIIPQNVEQAFLQIGVGTSAMAAYLLLVLSLRVDSALMSSIGRTSDIVFGVIFNFTLLGVEFDWFSFCGSMLVMFSIMVPSIVRLILTKHQAIAIVEN